MQSRKTIDINCDMGESYGSAIVGNDAALMPYITSCNLACGMHGGDPKTIEETIDLAIQHKVTIGAHPSYPDLAHFGRKKMNIVYTELKNIIIYQVQYLKDMVQKKGGKLQYIKPHGALYNSAAYNASDGQAVIDAIKTIDPRLPLLGLAGSTLSILAGQNNIQFISEAFADRRYQSNGQLVNRKMNNAVIHCPTLAANQVLQIIQNNEISSVDNKAISIHADSICIHGDNPNAKDILKEIDRQLMTLEIKKKSFIAS